MNPRILAFFSVGAAGFFVQMTVLALLSLAADWPAALATAVAVEAAVLTNFFWHERWTWRDRTDKSGRATRLVRFHVTSGMTSIVGNTLVTLASAALLGLSPILANVLAVALFSVVNYLAADRWVFAKRAPAGMLAMLVVFSASSLNAAQLTPQAIAAWNKHVAATEASLPQHEHEAPLVEPQGRTFDVPDGTIHEWRGSVLVRGVTVRQVVDALLMPGIRQEDVAESRVLEQHGDSLRMYLKLVRHVIVTVTYDTEHDVQYVRRSQGFATSRSVATKIVESGGADRGFLWRLNSYWRYRQVGDAVQIDVVSLSLSRDIPWLVRPMAQPIVDHIGRESMSRTLETVRQRTSNRQSVGVSR